MAPVNVVPVTIDPYNDARVRFAFVKLMDDSAAVDPAATACADVPKYRPLKSAPLKSTPGPMMRPAAAYSTYPDPGVNVGPDPEVATSVPEVFIPVSAAPEKSTPVMSITLRRS